MPGQIVIERKSPAHFGYVRTTLIVEASKKFLEIIALIDTGADYTLIRTDILNDLGIPAAGRVLGFTGAGARKTVSTAHVMLGFTGLNSAGERVTIEVTKEVGASDLLTEQAILGLDILQHFDLNFERSGRVRLTWP
jgi:predicted aspartyl protease